MRSIWFENETETDYKQESLRGDVKKQVCIIGGGLCGILTAHMLKEKGVESIVLEAGSVANGQTGGTTAKITLQHGCKFSKLLKELGAQRAGMYFNAAKAAIDKYACMIKEMNIDCDFERRDSYIYTLKNEEKLFREVEAANKMGLNASFVKNSELEIPLATLGAVKVQEQAQFNPIKFIRHITKGLTVYENTPAISIDGNRIITDNGSVLADNIVFACNYPIVDFPGLYFMKVYTERSYVLAIKNATDICGMYMDENTNGLSFRRYGDTLLLGGGSHRTGKMGGGYDVLYKKARALYPAKNIVGRWSAQDCITPDGIAYIGRYAKNRDNWYVATGFGKWGMTTSMTAAGLISDMICNKRNDMEEIFSPRRFSIKTVGRVATMSIEAIKGMARQVCVMPDKGLEDVKPNTADKVVHKGCKYGVYNDNGVMEKVTTRCSHLGCELNWNSDELSWDCPCHGSRFTKEGRVINGPAKSDISFND